MRFGAVAVGLALLGAVGTARGEPASCRSALNALAAGRSAAAAARDLEVPEAFVRACAHVQSLRERHAARRAARDARAARRRAHR